MAKAAIRGAKSVKRVTAANKGDEQLEGDDQSAEAGRGNFGASNRRVEPTTRLTKGAVGGRVPECGSK